MGTGIEIFMAIEAAYIEQRWIQRGFLRNATMLDEHIWGMVPYLTRYLKKRDPSQPALLRDVTARTRHVLSQVSSKTAETLGLYQA